MAAGVQVTGTANVLQKIKGRSLKGKKTGELFVGYSAPYAVYVHEDLTKKHSNGQAKFLEQASRVNRNQMIQILDSNLKNKESLVTALTRVGKFLLAESKKLVPVDTGKLRDSGFYTVT